MRICRPRIPSIQRPCCARCDKDDCLVLFLTLMPIAMTLALLWKIKEAIFTSFFEIER
jgi:hypothetical protein